MFDPSDPASDPSAGPAGPSAQVFQIGGVKLDRDDVLGLALQLCNQLANAQNRFCGAVDDGTKDFHGRWQSARVVAAAMILKASRSFLQPAFGQCPEFEQWINHICDGHEPSVTAGPSEKAAPKAMA